MSVYTRSTRHHIPEDGILRTHRGENLKSYTLEYILIKLHVKFRTGFFCLRREKRPLGRPTDRLDYNTEIFLMEMWREAVKWTQLIRDTDQYTVFEND
jgi:hypothetical protein